MFLKASMIQVSNEYTLPKQLISLRNIHDKLINKVNICFPGGLVIKNLLTNECRRCGFDPWVGKIPWRRKWQPTQYSCPGNLLDRGAWWPIVHGVTKELDRTQ